jgi:putative ABC transport system permease protein
MIWLRLGFANLCLSPLGSLVTLLLIGLSTAGIVLLLLVSTQLEQTMARDAQGIDLVLGAPGSPVQLVLSAVYHADVPTGNILLRDAVRWSDDPRVAAAIPLALGDSHRGFRIVGTTRGYTDLYDANLDSGRYWDSPMEAVAGAAAAAAADLHVNTLLSGAHGLSANSHSQHAQPYRIVGILAPTGTVIDRLILTSLNSVWRLHDDPSSLKHQAPTVTSTQTSSDSHSHEVPSDTEHHTEESAAHITAMLLRYRSPLAALSLPREINASGHLQAAAPAMEVARVLLLIGVGLDGLKAFSWVLVGTAFLSLFASLYGSLRTRSIDLAILRCLGANRWEILSALLVEGLLLACAGLVLGVSIGHGTMEIVARWLNSSRSVSFTGWTWLPSETLLLVSLLGAALMAAALPAIHAYHTDVARTLSQP